MWAEWEHATDGAVPPEADPRWVCVFEADLQALDLRDAATRRALRVGLAALTADWSPDRPNPATLRVAAAATRLGVDALIVPSAARSDGWNAVILPPGFHTVRLLTRRREVPRPV